MTQEFITVHGKVVIERGVLFVRSIKVPFSETVIWKFMKPLLPLAAFCMHLLWEDDPAHRNTALVIWGFLFVTRIPELFYLLWSRSFATRIPLHHIVSHDLVECDNGLETKLELKLKSGRTRIITFRTLEKQAESLVSHLSMQTTIQTA